MALAQRGSVYAKVAIGWMHETGAGYREMRSRLAIIISTRQGLAIRWLTSISVCSHGVLEGTKKRRAADCFLEASRQGHVFGMREVALRMLRGREGLASIPRGLYLYIKAMVSGVVLAARNPKSERLLR